jgi:ribosome-associated protein
MTKDLDKVKPDTVKLDSVKTEISYLDIMKAAVIDALEDIKGFDIAVMDVRKLTNMTSYMIVCSATSSRQAKAIGDNVREQMKEKNYTIRGTEGEKEGEWVLVDLNDIVVHIMVPTTRAYYNLEQLWGDAEARRGHIKGV